MKTTHALLVILFSLTLMQVSAQTDKTATEN